MRAQDTCNLLFMLSCSNLVYLQGQVTQREILHLLAPRCQHPPWRDQVQQPGAPVRAAQAPGSSFDAAFWTVYEEQRRWLPWSVLTASSARWGQRKGLPWPGSLLPCPGLGL